MKRIRTILLIHIFLLAAALPLLAGEIRVVTTYNYIASITSEVGGDRVTVIPLAGGSYDPHTIVPRPSYIAKLRRADLFIINGAQLEIGWAPPLLKRANNPSIMPGSKGFLDLSGFVGKIEVPSGVSREMGDIHPDGNPHFYLDPHNIPALAKAVSNKLSAIDPGNAPFYASRLNEFLGKWDTRMKEWDRVLTGLKDTRVIEYHKLFDYIIKRYGIVLAGTVEPLPGIPPTARHTVELEKIIRSQKVSAILQDVYNSSEASRHLSKKFGIRLIILPHDVKSVSGADNIFSLFDVIVKRLSR